MDDSDMSGAALSYSDYSGANLQRSNLSGAWLSLASLVGANLNQGSLAGSILFGADLTGADLSENKLNGAIFIGANLNGADLRGADLSGAMLVLPVPPEAGTDFSYQNLTGAELRQALVSTELESMFYDPVIRELNETQLKPLLKDALLQGVLYNDATIWPLGFEIPSSAILMP